MDEALEGRGVHTGGVGVVRFERAEGPVRLRRAGVSVRLDELVFDGELRSTRARDAGGRTWGRTVEHLFAALAAEGVHRGLVVELEGEELPLLDGGARAFIDALRRLALPQTEPPLAIARSGTVTVGQSEYVFERGVATSVEVEVDFADPRIDRVSRWDGDRDDFRARVAPARTFAFAGELAQLADRRLASHVTPEAVILFTTDGVLSAGAPYVADEPARHKLLDLVGDLYAHGGPPRGRVYAARPGHAATHAAIARASAEGILVRRVTPV